MAAKTPKKAAGAPRPGLMRRLTRFTVFFLGLLTLVGIADSFLTARVLTGSWQYHAPNLSDQTIDAMMDTADARAAAKDPAGKGPRRPNREIRAAIARVGTAIMGAVASNVKLRINDGGFRIDGALGARAASSIFRSGGGPDADLTGCMSGSYIAAFPILRAVCGDGSGRTLWFFIKGWPSQDLKLFPLPIGNQELRDRTKALIGEGAKSREKLEAASELLTLQFSRTPS